MKVTRRKKTMRNFVAKNAKMSGAGQHKHKRGPLASRARQKQNYLKGKE
jgi:hypothetical protein